MKTSTKIILIILLIIVVVVGIYAASGGPVASIKGCYVAHLNKDVYTLTVNTQKSSEIEGTLSYKNFEKDSSSGPLIGTFKDDILMGTYTFQSEGTQSVRQVIFKKEGDAFVQGFGPVQVDNGEETFLDPAGVTFDSWEFKKEECPS